MAGRVKEEKVRLGRGQGQEREGNALHSVVWYCVVSVSGHFVNKPWHLAESCQSVNASFSPYVEPSLCFFVVFPDLAANRWPRSPPTGQNLFGSCNLRAVTC